MRQPGSEPGRKLKGRARKHIIRSDHCHISGTPGFRVPRQPPERRGPGDLASVVRRDSNSGEAARGVTLYMLSP
eukprot:441411-Hanusia_phi.AAC.1